MIKDSYNNTNFKRIKKIYKCHKCKKELENAWPFSRGNPTNEIQYLCVECKNDIAVDKAISEIYTNYTGNHKRFDKGKLIRNPEGSLPVSTESVSNRKMSKKNKKNK